MTEMRKAAESSSPHFAWSEFKTLFLGKFLSQIEYDRERMLMYVGSTAGEP